MTIIINSLYLSKSYVVILTQFAITEHVWAKLVWYNDVCVMHTLFSKAWKVLRKVYTQPTEMRRGNYIFNIQWGYAIVWTSLLCMMFCWQCSRPSRKTSQLAGEFRILFTFLNVIVCSLLNLYLTIFKYYLRDSQNLSILFLKLLIFVRV